MQASVELVVCSLAAQCVTFVLRGPARRYPGATGRFHSIPQGISIVVTLVTAPRTKLPYNRGHWLARYKMRLPVLT